MQKWYHIFPKNTGLSLYVWLVFCVLPFYFIFKSSSNIDLAVGLVMIVLFFIVYRLSFMSSNWFMYVWISIGIILSIYMTLFFGYVYFALFLAYFIGHIQQKPGFISMYVIHLVGTLLAITASFFLKTELLISQLPFIIICLIAVILLPFTIYNRKKQDKLESMLDDANEKISDLLIIEERQRIARDLHDTLGQKLSMIGLKSDLASKIVSTRPEDAKLEMKDIQLTARTALKEVREMVSDMRMIRLEDEIIRIKQLLKAAQIDLEIKGDFKDIHTSLLIENVISMCLKESVTNIVNHSQASLCTISFSQSKDEIVMNIHDNGRGFETNNPRMMQSHGLKGMAERIEFMNGTFAIDSEQGTTININIPFTIQQ